MKVLCVFGQHNYGVPERGEGYEFGHFIPALRRLGHEVVFFESRHKAIYADFAELNRKLLETVERERPTVIFCVLSSYEVWLETLAMLHNGSEAVLIGWSTDDSWKYAQFSRFVAPAFDIFATTYRAALTRARHDGLNNYVLTQWAADSASLVEPLPAVRCRHSVTFVGSAYGNRPRWIDELRRRGIKVECFGHGWKHGPVTANTVARIMRESIISLNFADSGLVMRGLLPEHSRQIKARLFEVPGAGGFLLTEDAAGLEEFYLPGEEVAVFSGIDELVSKIKFFLAHPEERDRIARAGFLRTRQEHTYDHRFRELFTIAEQHMSGAEGRSQQSRKVKIDSAQFAGIVAMHRSTVWLKLLRGALLLPCMLIWGRQRGPRAARRLLYELSWRVAGRSTYSASGWVGRMFYHES